MQIQNCDDNCESNATVCHLAKIQNEIANILSLERSAPLVNFKNANDKQALERIALVYN